MDPTNSVLDISSDEEPEGNYQQMNLEWLCKQLFEDGDDSDDVVVVGEVLNSKQVEKKYMNSPVAGSNVDEKKVQEEEEDDDDCVVLDGDPDKMVAVEDNQEDGSDELVVVGEKGQVACRDYPHPRHLCVKYPFSSTLHKFHCEQCHCYVCDAVAPCSLWGTGMSIVDHCHATDKQEVWKTERKNFKLKRCSSLPVIEMSESTPRLVPSPASTQMRNQLRHLSRSSTMPCNHDSLHSTRSVPAVRSMPSVNAVRSMPSMPAVGSMPSVPAVGSMPSVPAVGSMPPVPAVGSMPSVPTVRSMPSVPAVRSVPAARCMPSVPAVRSMPSVPAVVPVASATNSDVPNIADLRSGSNRFPPSSIQQLWPGGYTKFVSQKVRYQNAPSLGAQPAVFKRVKTGVTYRPKYHSGYAQPHTSIRSYVPSTHNQPVCGEANKRDSHPRQWINAGHNVNAGTATYPLQRSHHVNTLHTSAAYQYVTENQSTTDTMGTQRLNQQATYPSDMPSAPDALAPWLDSTISVSTQWTLPLQADFGSGPHASDLWVDTANSNSRQSGELSHRNVSSPWMDNSNSTQPNQAMQAAEGLGYQPTQSVNVAADHFLPSEHNSETAPVPDNQASAVPELENLHFEFEDWLMENHGAVSKPSEPPLFMEQNILSPDDAHIDSILVYDDEWNVMTSNADA